MCLLYLTSSDKKFSIAGKTVKERRKQLSEDIDDVLSFVHCLILLLCFLIITFIIYNVSEFCGIKCGQNLSYVESVMGWG